MSFVCLAPRVGKKVVVLGTGGTIAGSASTSGDHVGYTAGQLGVAHLLAAVPELAAWSIESEQVAQVDSKDMTLTLWLQLLARAKHHLARSDVAGVVITHGTDTLEETAYFLHRLLPQGKAVVLTAAMRPATALVPDGPQNLLDAVALAGSEVLSGVVCAVGGQVFGADDVVKLHTYRVDAFGSGDAGPLGWIEAGQWRALREPALNTFAVPASWPQPADWPRVDVVFSHAGQDGAVVRGLLALQAIDPSFKLHGLVVAGTGNGTVHEDLLRALSDARQAGVALVRVSRCVQGRVLGEVADLPVAPVASPFKARIHLMLALLEP